jgi:NAD(P)-dependent dehydrogenase (short-subunit alcohol dehydrogenase family)
MILPGQSALVTGGTGGIGRAIALALAAEGCQATVTGKTDAEVRQFDSPHRNIVARTLDVTDDGAVGRLVSGFDHLNILVNAAGMILRANQEHHPLEFDKVIDVNLSGTMRLCAACRPLLARTKGCVLNIASMLSFFGSSSVPAYSASKGGVVQLTKSLAIAWADDGIRVNAIAPGWIETAMTRPLMENAERSRSILERTPMKRWGKPEDVAGAAVFLCSSQAAFITGAILPVDGGYSCA